jgi:hypothetical protein
MWTLVAELKKEGLSLLAQHTTLLGNVARRVHLGIVEDSAISFADFAKLWLGKRHEPRFVRKRRRCETHEKDFGRHELVADSNQLNLLDDCLRAVLHCSVVLNV